MREIDCKQGTDEWLRARMAMPTASRFGEIISPVELKPSASAAKYRALLLAEWYMSIPLDNDFATAYMERGIELEASAVAWYEFSNDVETRAVGLCVTDDGRVGGSPDRLVGDEGGLEIKCPGLVTHAHYLMEDGAPLRKEYRSQVQGMLWITGRKWWDLCSWNPDLPSVVVRVEPDEAYQKAIGPALDKFLETFETAKHKLAPLKADRDKAKAAALAEAMETAESGPF